MSEFYIDNSGNTYYWGFKYDVEEGFYLNWDLGDLMSGGGGGGNYLCESDNDCINIPYTLDPDIWHHITWVAEGTTQKLYVNGQLINQAEFYNFDGLITSDFNGDGSLNILDIIELVNLILN